MEAPLRSPSPSPARPSRWAPLLALLLVSAAGGPPRPVLAQSADAAAPPTFRTRFAEFAHQPWSSLPGWSDDAHREAFAAFSAACAGLQRRPGWQSACERARGLGSVDDTRARGFFEEEFAPYRVTALSERESPLLTGYFEPVLDGALQRGGRFQVPVLGVPDDLLHLDARRLPARRAGEPLRAVLEGRELVPLAPDAPAPAGRVVLAVDADVLDDDLLDRRFRVRVDGERVRRYWSRADIEQGRATAVPVAWVDDADALYVMQVQGSGRVRLSGGRVLHLAYADQNGHPFRPVAAAPGGVRARSLDGSGGDAPAPPPPSPSVRAMVAAEPEVQRVIDALLAQPRRAGGPETSAAPQGSPGRTVASSPRPAARAADDAGPGTRTAGATANLPGAAGSVSEAMLSRWVSARRVDPSYVFFRSVQGDTRGPVGALGVPLTATRSIAVDPRVTPLGAPVFIDASRGDASRSIRRLVVAQDTGGAIRGAVRGDFFWGTGPQAGFQAFRTRDPLSMWVLLPRAFVPPAAAGVRSRSLDDASDAGCTMPDDTYC